MPNATETLRSNWPPGFIGSLSYFWDHCICRYNKPVDWRAHHLADHGFGIPIHIDDHRTANLHWDEYQIFMLLTKGHTELEVRKKLRLNAISYANNYKDLTKRLGTDSIKEMKQIAVRNAL